MLKNLFHRWRPYRVERTRSLSTSEVKRHRAQLVLGWGTAWEAFRVLPAFFFFHFSPVVTTGTRHPHRTRLESTPPPLYPNSGLDIFLLDIVGNGFPMGSTFDLVPNTPPRKRY